MIKIKYGFKICYLLVVITVAFGACKKNNSIKCDEQVLDACTEDITKTNIRIKNISKYDFCNVVVNPTSGNVNCGIINKGEMTCYRSFDTAYRYAYIKLFIDNKEFTLQPIDYVGEQPLGIGKFTYLLDIADYNNRELTITLQKD